MALANATFRGTAVIDFASDVNVRTVTMPGTSDTEQAVTITNATKKLQIKARELVTLKIARNTGDIANGTFFTLRPGTVWSEDNILTSGVTLYLSSSGSSTIIEIMEWT